MPLPHATPPFPATWKSRMVCVSGAGLPRLTQKEGIKLVTIGIASCGALWPSSISTSHLSSLIVTVQSLTVTLWLSPVKRERLTPNILVCDSSCYTLVLARPTWIYFVSFLWNKLFSYRPRFVPPVTPNPGDATVGNCFNYPNFLITIMLTYKDILI